MLVNIVNIVNYFNLKNVRANRAVRLIDRVSGRFCYYDQNIKYTYQYGQCFAALADCIARFSCEGAKEPQACPPLSQNVNLLAHTRAPEGGGGDIIISFARMPGSWRTQLKDFEFKNVKITSTVSQMSDTTKKNAFRWVIVNFQFSL